MSIFLWKDGEYMVGGDLYAKAVRQGVIPFSSAAVRDGIIPLPAKGMLTMLTDVNEYQIYDGADWRTIFMQDDTYIGVETGALGSDQSIAAGASYDAVTLTTSLKKGQWYLSCGMVDLQSDSTSYVIASASLTVDSVARSGQITAEVDDENRSVFSKTWFWKYDGTTGGSKSIKLVVQNHDASNAISAISVHTRLIHMGLGITPTVAV